MSRSRLLRSPFSTSALSRKHSSSVLHPTNILQTSALTRTPFMSARNLGVRRSRSHLHLPSFVHRAFSTSPQRSSAAPTFYYSISASYSDKRHRLDLGQNTYTFDLSQDAMHSEPAPMTDSKASRPKSGQDAFFISSIGATSNMAFGVVDGVGGWDESGVDAADFSHGLCHHMAKAAREYPEDAEKGVIRHIPRPEELLDYGYARVMEDKSIAAGGSTACVATASPDGLLHSANLGDSGYVHVAPFQLKYHSRPQTHRFNTPFQLSKLPQEMLKQVALFGGAKPYSELPKDSATMDHTLEHGDVLVFATDGVWDNLSSEDALRTVTRIMVRHGAWAILEEGTTGVTPEFPARLKTASIPVATANGEHIGTRVNGLSAMVASAITKEAKEASVDRRRDGPFAKEVQRLYPAEKWKGGKADDICTVVAVVVKYGV